MVYRTKTYIAGDWTGDSDLISKLEEWNNNESLQLSFVNVHEVTQSNDDSLNCSIKKSLRKRMSVSKTFVLIVGEKTKGLRSGSCSTCRYYYSLFQQAYCQRNKNVDNRSYIEFECEMALKDYLDGKLKKIVVIYNGLTTPDYTRCPSILLGVGKHIGSDRIEGGTRFWDYIGIKNAICG